MNPRMIDKFGCVTMEADEGVCGQRICKMEKEQYQWINEVGFELDATTAHFLCINHKLKLRRLYVVSCEIRA